VYAPSLLYRLLWAPIYVIAPFHFSLSFLVWSGLFPGFVELNPVWAAAITLVGPFPTFLLTVILFFTLLHLGRRLALAADSFGAEWTVYLSNLGFLVFFFAHDLIILSIYG